MAKRTISVEINDPNLDETKERQLTTLFRLLEAAYDEQTLEHRATKDAVAITMHFPQTATFKLKDAYALALSTRP